MKVKALFLMLYVPLHSFLSLVVIQRAFNPPPGGSSVFFKLLMAIIATPVLLPLVMFDPDGDRLPKWFQILSVPLNSLLSGLLVILAFAFVVRFVRPSHSNPENESIAGEESAPDGYVAPENPYHSPQ